MANYGLIGHPLSHSFSQEYFIKKFENQKLNHRYLNLDIADLKSIKEAIQLQKLKGFNVTIPYKQAIIEHLQSVDKAAMEIGAVNCVRVTDQGWQGFNTDYIGFIESISPLIKVHHKKALILGTGGASLAVAYGLKQLNIEYKFVSRDYSKGITYSELKGKLNDFQIIVNSTPLGTFPEINQCPDLPYNELNQNHLCFDLVYNPDLTLFIQKAKQYEAVVKNGLEMLEIQADEAWEIWS